MSEQFPRGLTKVVDDPDRRFSFKRIRDGIKVNSAFVAEGMEDVEGAGVLLLASPYQIDPCWEIATDIITLEGLAVKRDEE